MDGEYNAQQREYWDYFAGLLRHLGLERDVDYRFLGHAINYNRLALFRADGTDVKLFFTDFQRLSGGVNRHIEEYAAETGGRLLLYHDRDECRNQGGDPYTGRFWYLIPVAGGLDSRHEGYLWRDLWETLGGERFSGAELLRALDDRYGLLRVSDPVRRTLLAQKQVILAGPPGTGKTRKARELAQQLYRFCDVEHRDGDLLPRELSLADFGTLQAQGRCVLLQFHPGYSYADFVEGLSADETGFHAAPRVLRDLARRAVEDPLCPYVLIIDEINRAQLAEVFGELLYALEYRGRPVRTMLTGQALPDGTVMEPLVIPENLYLIGTMNTADRSIVSMDYAMRRRFAFIQVPAPTPEEAIGRIHPAMADTYTDVYQDVLDHAASGVAPEDILPGVSYYMDTRAGAAGDEAETLEFLRFKLRYQLFPLLREYWKNGLLTDEFFNIDDRTVSPEEYFRLLESRLRGPAPEAAEA